MNISASAWVVCVALVGPAECVYRYDAAGRRDPFVSPLNRVAAPSPGPMTGTRDWRLGLRGLMVEDVTQLTGVMTSGPRRWAIVRGPEGRSFIVRPGDRLIDGYVGAITFNPSAVVLVQHVSTTQRRRIRLTIREGQ